MTECLYTNHNLPQSSFLKHKVRKDTKNWLSEKNYFKTPLFRQTITHIISPTKNKNCLYIENITYFSLLSIQIK